MAWLAKNAISTGGTISRNATDPKTAVFAHSTGSRLGTAVKLARIIPVEYSPVMTSTPRTAIASWERLTPASAMSSGWRSARSWGLIDPQCDEVTAANRTGRAIVSRKPAASDHRVERSECSFVLSEYATRAWVTWTVCAVFGGGE